MANSSKPAQPKVASGYLIVLKAVAIPLIILGFYAWALSQVNTNTRNAFLRANDQNEKLAPAEKEADAKVIAKFDFVRLILDSPSADFEDLRASLERAGVAGEVRHLHWGLVASEALLGMLIISLLAIVALNLMARRSQQALVRCTRIAWTMASISALLQVVLLTPLITYGGFELTVLLAERYYPQLLFGLAFAGIATIIAAGKILLRKVPLRATERMAREVSPQDSPELWAAVNAAAAKLNTTPPDRIIAGMQLNFYVTELAVQHDYGVVEGKTLFLSYPLMRQLSEEEIVAIIGHELGHFMGDDTRLTREFYPLWRKAGETLQQFGSNPIIAWTSFQFLDFFAWTFGKTESATSREREILADQKAAALTSPAIAARALVKFHAMTEALHRGFTSALTADAPKQNVFETALAHKLPDDPDFWKNFFEERLPHPLDSHPPLHVRLGALGQAMTVEQAQEITREEVPNAFGKWFASREQLFTGLLEKTEEVAESLREDVKIQKADYATEAGRELLNRHFPEVRWKRKSTRPWFAAIMAGLITAGLAVTVFFAYDGIPSGMIVLLAVAALLGVRFTRVHWIRHSHSEITLTADTVYYSGWLRPLPFSEVKTISAHNTNGSMSLNFHLKEKIPPLWRMALPMRPKTVNLNIMTFPAKPVDMGNTIFRYFTRQKPPAETGKA